MKTKQITVDDLQGAIEQTAKRIRGISANQINPRFRLAATKAQNHRLAMQRHPKTKSTV